jgi:hypothetical protein
MLHKKRSSAEKKRFEKNIKEHVKPGALHRQMGIPEGQKIPTSKLESMKNSPNPQTRKRANFALNARRWHHGG